MDAGWLQRVRTRAVQPPRMPRQPLWAGATQVGTVEADFLQALEFPALPDGNPRLSKASRAGVPGWCLHGDITEGLNCLAAVLHAAGLSGAWRNEQLAVWDEATGQQIGTVERAAVRPLGIATRAVHLLGRTPDGKHWVQQRALDKSNDPGLWDTLMGGMVSAADTLASALQRETWEEAGLHLKDLQELSYGGNIRTQRPARDGGGAGYVVERIDWYRCVVPQPVVPRNQDGEVAQFRLMDDAELMERLVGDEFTLEAALLLMEAAR